MTQNELPMSRDYPFNNYPYNGYPYKGYPYTNYPSGDSGEGQGRSRSRGHSDSRSGGSIILSAIVLIGFAIWLSIKIIRFVFWLLRLIILQVKKRDPLSGSLLK